MLCIISSGTENFNIVKLCQQNNIPHTVFIDSLFRPYQDKDPELVTQRIQHIMEYMTSQGATHVIVSPTIELLLLQSEFTIHHSSFTIIPLFTTYLNHCLNHSLVGKIGLVGGYSDISQIESLFLRLAKNHILTEHQRSTKKFQQPLSKWTRDVSMREYFSRLYSPRSLLINKTIKEDLKYFKDANIDTLIPLNYNYFNYQRTISKYFNSKKQKFHKRDIIADIFKKITSDGIQDKTTQDTPLVLLHTGSTHLFEHKKRQHILTQGGTHTVEYKTIHL